LRLLSTKVMSHREEMRESYHDGITIMKGKSSGRGGGSFQGISAGGGSSGSQSFHPDNLSDPLSTVEGWNKYVADSSGGSNSWAEGDSEAEGTTQSVTRSSVLIPVMGKEVSSVQYRTIDEQIFRAAQKLFDQKDRHFAVRYFDGPKAPLFVKTPTVTPATVRTEVVEEYRRKILEKLPCALRMADAAKVIDGREAKILADIVKVHEDEATTARGRSKKKSW
jgi:hypothetical protein